MAANRLFAFSGTGYQSISYFPIKSILLFSALLIGAVNASFADDNKSTINNTGTIVLAQASTETDGKTYQAEVIQVDGTMKKVSYQKYKDGVIIPPETNDGKLVDGSPATSNQKLNIGKNRSILARYDKDSRVLLAVVDKNDILGKARKDVDAIIKKAEKDESISKKEFLDGFTGIYISVLGGFNMEKSINGMEAIGRIKLNLSPSEIGSIKSEAQKKANESWKSVLGDGQ